MNIREATNSDPPTIAMLISEGNKDVAARFGLNSANCPKHPSSCIEGWVQADLARGEIYFMIEDGNTPIGCVAYESPSAAQSPADRGS